MTDRDQHTPEDSDHRSADLRRANGRIAAILFGTAALASVPAIQLLKNPPVPTWVNLFVPVGFLFAFACYVVPWDRLRAEWLQVIPIAATAQIALAAYAMRPHQNIVVVFYFFVVIFVALAFERRSEIALHAGLVVSASARPVLSPSSPRETLVRVLVTSPVLGVAAGTVALLRERLEARQQELTELVRRDALTGVGNYRLLHERLAYELARHERRGRRFAVLVLDVDNFKQVNERFGHLEGDRLLQQVGEVLEQTVRAEDTVSRQGGDEFSVLVPEVGEEEAAALANRITRALGSVVTGDGQLTSSIGWAVFPEDGDAPDALLARADDAQRLAKRESQRAAEEGAQSKLRVLPDRGSQATG